MTDGPSDTCRHEALESQVDGLRRVERTLDPTLQAELAIIGLRNR